MYTIIAITSFKILNKLLLCGLFLSLKLASNPVTRLMLNGISLLGKYHCTMDIVPRLLTV